MGAGTLLPRLAGHLAMPCPNVPLFRLQFLEGQNDTGWTDPLSLPGVASSWVMGGASLSQPGLGPLGSWSPCSKSRMGAFSSRGSRWSVPGAVKLHRGSMRFWSKWLLWRLVKIKICVVEGFFLRGVSLTIVLLVLKVGARILPPELLLAKVGQCVLPNTSSPVKCLEDM